MMLTGDVIFFVDGYPDALSFPTRISRHVNSGD